MYTPKAPPAHNLKELQPVLDWLMEELQAISRAAQETTELELRPSAREPEFPREGMIVFADGTNWNPGSGAGEYIYQGGAWVIRRGGPEPNTYGVMTDGTNNAPAETAGDTFKFRGANGVKATVTNDDATHGDNVLHEMDINAITAATPALDDKSPFADTSNSNAIRRATFQQILDLIGSLATEASPDFTADFAAIFDQSGNAAKKLPLSQFGKAATLISTTNLTGSSVTISIPTGYTDIVIRIRELSTSNAVQPSMIFSENGGTTDLTSPGSMYGAGSMAASAINVLTNASLNAADNVDGVFTLWNYLSTGTKMVTGSLVRSNNGDGWIHQRRLTSTAAVNAVKFTVPAGSFDAGSIDLWGVL